MKTHKTLKSAMRDAKTTNSIQKAPSINVKKTKVVVNMRVDLDILELLKKEAENEGVPYQTYLNSLLRKSLDNSLVKRVEKLEKIILKRKAA